MIRLLGQKPWDIAATIRTVLSESNSVNTIDAKLGTQFFSSFKCCLTKAPVSFVREKGAHANACPCVCARGVRTYVHACACMCVCVCVCVHACVCVSAIPFQ